MARLSRLVEKLSGENLIYLTDDTGRIQTAGLTPGVWKLIEQQQEKIEILQVENDRLRTQQQLQALQLEELEKLRKDFDLLQSQVKQLIEQQP